MKDIKTFIEKAIEGGYVCDQYDFYRKDCSDKTSLGFLDIATESIFLDPLAWQAVGKSLEGKGLKYQWTKEVNRDGATHDDFLLCDDHGWQGSGKYRWQHKMLGMTQALIEGKSIEEYIKTL